MSQSASGSQPSSNTSRRDFVKTAGAVAAATTLLGLNVPKVHAAEDNTIRVALVGCGGRGTGAAVSSSSGAMTTARSM